MVLEKVCEYLYFNEKSKEEKDVPDMEFPPELCLELLMAADFLQSESVIDSYDSLSEKREATRYSSWRTSC